MGSFSEWRKGRERERVRSNYSIINHVGYYYAKPTRSTRRPHLVPTKAQLKKTDFPLLPFLVPGWEGHIHFRSRPGTSVFILKSSSGVIRLSIAGPTHWVFTLPLLYFNLGSYFFFFSFSRNPITVFFSIPKFPMVLNNYATDSWIHTFRKGISAMWNPCLGFELGVA